MKILIVDDDKKLLSVLKTIFIEEDHEIVTCSDGLDAIKTCRNQVFDLIITDLMMPGANGMEVLKEAKKIHPETLVILITGYASLETAVQAIRDGAYDYLTKPFKLEEIKIVVRNAEEKILLIRENRRLLQKLQEAYTELHMVKKVMSTQSGEDHTNSDEAAGNGDNHEPFIAGSMLPLYYTENRKALASPALTDLERISTLREKGLISEEEFNLCKTRLFKNISL
ncbi:MAG: sigma-54-dependent Fis family transcriptional regulator [Deltaproteobacteria bacterium]|nr:sigma-54-dependent Fis family transcriptional regulator [Deltaproteobacteria bacterium]